MFRQPTLLEHLSFRPKVKLTHKPNTQASPGPPIPIQRRPRLQVPVLTTAQEKGAPIHREVARQQLREEHGRRNFKVAYLFERRTGAIRKYVPPSSFQDLSVCAKTKTP